MVFRTLILCCTLLLPAVFSQGQSKGIVKSVATPDSLNVITSSSDFDELARVFQKGTPYALPHLMFLIDRRDSNKIYYINSQKFRFHADFANASYLSLERGEEFTTKNYLSANRRFILGTLAWQTPIQKWTFEFWEGDPITADQIKLTYDIVNRSFFAPVAFKPNSTRQTDVSDALGINRISTDDVNRGQVYLPLNMARGIGRIHVIDKLDDTVEIGYNEILVLREVPISLPPVAGLIIAKPSTPLSHINLLAKGWDIPNAYIKNADQLFRDLDTYWVEFETGVDTYTIKHAEQSTLKEWEANQKARNELFHSPKSDLNVRKIASLREIRSTDSIAYGSKAANLGELTHAKIKGAVVPDGFSIPFSYFDKFMKDNGFDEKAADLLDDHEFVHNPRYRRQKLKEFRAEIQNGKIDARLQADIVRRWRTMLGGRPVYVRSSSNSEDLPNFSGAGLYSSVKNVVNEKQLVEGVKTVWASLWNFEAYEARERNFIEHTGVYMSAFIQSGVAMDDGGVMITANPFNKADRGAVYISATFGHNLPVTGGDGEVEQKVIPEQILFSPASDAVRVLTRSDQDVMFVPDVSGGLKAVKFTNDRRVLSPAMIRRLARTAENIKRIFGGVEQDIEWGVMSGQLYVIQARPYLDPSRSAVRP